MLLNAHMLFDMEKKHKINSVYSNKTVRSQVQFVKRCKNMINVNLSLHIRIGLKTDFSKTLTE